LTALPRPKIATAPPPDLGGIHHRIFGLDHLGDDPWQSDTVDLKTIMLEVQAAQTASVNPQEILAKLKSQTYGKRVTISDANVTELNELDTLPLTEARYFAGLYTLEGTNSPEPSSLDTTRIANELYRLMNQQTWKADSETIACSGTGLTILNQKSEGLACTYRLLTSRYKVRRLRLGQRVSLDATLCGLSIESGKIEAYGFIRQVQTP
jgi:hypothetical protein